MYQMYVHSKRFLTRSGTSSQWPYLSWARPSVERFLNLLNFILSLFFFSQWKVFFNFQFVYWLYAGRLFNTFIFYWLSVERFNSFPLRGEVFFSFSTDPLWRGFILYWLSVSNVQVLSRSNKAAGLEEFRLDFFLEEKKTLAVVLTIVITITFIVT